MQYRQRKKNIKKTSKNFKKGVDNWERSWYYIKAVSRGHGSELGKTAADL